MKISLSNIGKRYHQHWIFKGVNYAFESGMPYAVLGANGSGKSTLLRIIAHIQNPSSGTLLFNDTNSKDKLWHASISYCAPGMDIIEELSLKEFLQFHFNFKPLLPNYTIEGVIKTMGLEPVAHKHIHEFSSGMKQRVKLAQAFFADTPILLLDEPCSNLDLQGIDMYQQWLQQHSLNRTVIIASNDEREYPNVKNLLLMSDYK
jgi:ABC-type multidrug transport system ATPase subunit